MRRIRNGSAWRASARCFRDTKRRHRHRCRYRHRHRHTRTHTETSTHTLHYLLCDRPRDVSLLRAAAAAAATATRQSRADRFHRQGPPGREWWGGQPGKGRGVTQLDTHATAHPPSLSLSVSLSLCLSLSLSVSLSLSSPLYPIACCLATCKRRRSA